MLQIESAGSRFSIPIQDVAEHKPLLDCADAMTLLVGGQPRVRVELSGARRWVAFEREVSGSTFVCVGWQETVGAVLRRGEIVSGSNRKALCWLGPRGRLLIGASDPMDWRR